MGWAEGAAEAGARGRHTRTRTHVPRRSTATERPQPHSHAPHQSSLSLSPSLILTHTHTNAQPQHTHTHTPPTLSTFVMRSCEIWEMWSRPEAPPMSTNAPYGFTLITVPSTTSPTCAASGQAAASSVSERQAAATRMHGCVGARRGAARRWVAGGAGRGAAHAAPPRAGPSRTNLLSKPAQPALAASIGSQHWQ